MRAKCPFFDNGGINVTVLSTFLVWTKIFWNVDKIGRKRGQIAQVCIGKLLPRIKSRLIVVPGVVKILAKDGQQKTGLQSSRPVSVDLKSLNA